METITSLNPKTLWFLVVCLLCFVVLFVVGGGFFWDVCMLVSLLACLHVCSFLACFVWFGFGLVGVDLVKFDLGGFPRILLL